MSLVIFRKLFSKKIIYFKKADPAHFIKRPLKPASPTPDCINMRMVKGERLKFIQMVRYKKGKDIDEIKRRMSRDWLLKIFPALKGSYNYAGKLFHVRSFTLRIVIMEWG